MTRLLPWVMMPSGWINGGGLREFRWGGSEGPNNAAALMTFVPILHRADRVDGTAQLTYDQLEMATSLSRTKISSGLTVLEDHGLIERATRGRSTYTVCNFDPSTGWAKFPAMRLYRDGQVAFFDELHLRKRTELDALKLWYLIIARRDNDVNLAKITYDQFTDLTGVSRDRIKTGLSVLAANGLVHIEHIPSRHSEYGVASAYRLPQIDGMRHMGTTGRELITEVDFDSYG